MCSHWMEIHTDPKNAVYNIISGARKREESYDPASIGLPVLQDEAETEKISADPFYKLEHQAEDVQRATGSAFRITELLEHSSKNWKDPYTLSQNLRKRFRTDKKEKVEVEKQGRAIADKHSLLLKILPASEKDRVIAGAIKWDAPMSVEQKKDQVIASSIFSRSVAKGFDPKRRKVATLKSTVSSRLRTKVDPFAVFGASTVTSSPVVATSQTADKSRAEIKPARPLVSGDYGSTDDERDERPETSIFPGRLDYLVTEDVDSKAIDVLHLHLSLAQTFVPATPLKDYPALSPNLDFFFGSSGAAAVGNKKLQCRVGPSLETMSVCNVNKESDPHFIDSPYFTGYVGVRVKNFKGVTADGTAPVASLPYFESKKRLFSIQVCGRFKHEHSANDVVFGSEFEHKVTLPTGAWVAMKFASLIDPALKSDVYAEKPWLWSPALCSYNLVNVTRASGPVQGAHPSIATDKTSGTEEHLGPDTSKPTDHSKEVSAPRGKVPGDRQPDQELAPWTWVGEEELQEDTTLLFEGQPTAISPKTPTSPPGSVPKAPFPVDGIAERRKYFQKESARKKLILRPDYLYNVEMFAPFIDLNTFDLNLGININLLQYLNKHPLRLISKSLTKNVPFFIIEFDLVDVEEGDEQEEGEDEEEETDA
ncbi:hypothetical protein HKX48_008651 [Thoreauomyces humboldtii]|nr:hypothetical protein HKX48_008651 [Thoreauomyces humboldtii]